jgi:DNA modification methylase
MVMGAVGVGPAGVGRSRALLPVEVVIAERAPVMEAVGTATVQVGDCLQLLSRLAAGSVHCCVTSPPYWGLRSYLPEDHPDKATEIGTETTPKEYVERMVRIFQEVRRVLHRTGTLWLNLGDSYARGCTGRADGGSPACDDWQRSLPVEKADRPRPVDLKSKDLVGVPWMVAFALREDGWYLRAENIWSKPNPMPDPVRDRTTRSHEQLFLLTKSERYYYDQEAIREPHQMRPQRRPAGHKRRRTGPGLPEHTWSGTKRDEPEVDGNPAGRNKRSVWTLSPEPICLGGRVIAVMPTKLALPCILAGTSARGCCPHCGAPWEREVERTSMLLRPGPGRAQLQQSSPGAASRTAATGTMLAPATVLTTGWCQTCSCPEHTPVPCTVLDPFAGSGTTGLVAAHNGRNFLGYEINPDNAELARARIANPRSISAKPQAPVEGQGQLFDKE